MLRHLIDLLFPPRESELLVRHTPSLLPYLKPQVEGRVTALLSYDVPLVKAAVVEAKFYANERAAKLLGEVLRAYLEELSGYVLVPIPLSQERLKERGHNQVETVVRHAGMVMDTGLLVRVRDTTPQTTLDGTARRQNLTGAFAVTRTPDPSLTYFVIDDVVTTGATMREAVSMLNGADADVRAIALAARLEKAVEMQYDGRTRRRG